MGKVNVVVVDATGNKEQKVGLPDDIRCGIIMVKLVEKIKLPSVGPDGNPISYKFIHKATGRQLLETQTMQEAGIKDGDVLRLQPEITAGAAYCFKCGTENADGTKFCMRCGNPLSNPAPVQPQSQVQAASQPAYQPQQAAAAPTPVAPAPAVNPAAFTQGPAAPAAEKAAAPAKKKSKVFEVIGMLDGAVSVALGLVTMNMSTGSTKSYSAYGGDAYTGIQNAAAQTATNVQHLAEILEFAAGMGLIVLGVALICYFGAKMKENQ